MQNSFVRRKIGWRHLSALALLLVGSVLAGCATTPTDPAFVVTNAQADHDIEQMQHDAKPLAHPLVIVGGYLDPDLSPPMYSNFFRSISRDAKIIPVSVGLCQSFAECRRVLIDAVDQACPSNDPVWTTQVDVVGASMGGLVARYAAAPSDDPAHPRRLRIARLFTISSPHRGAVLARSIGITDFQRDMAPGSAFLQRVAAADDQAAYQLIPYVHLGDEIVGQSNAAPPGRNPYWLANDSVLPPHLAAMLDHRIWADIARRLRGEAPLTAAQAQPPPSD